MGISETIKENINLTGSGRKKESPEPSSFPELRIVIAGGGTGGHLFPGIAIAEVFMKRQARTRVLFVTSGKRIEETVLANTLFEKKLISVEGIKGKGLFAKLASMCRLPKGMIDALRLLIGFKPDIVIGMGAYSAGPVIAGAWMLRIHRVIHEQNSIPGLTNRLLSGLAEKIYVSFPDTGFKSLVKHKINFTGNPVRNEIVQAAGFDGNSHKGSQKQKRLFNLLILGGSQGAHSINMAVLDSIRYLKDPDKFRFVHQTGIKDADEVSKVYQQNCIVSEVAPFFNDMADRYREADLVICRSGATTVAELTVTGKAVVFIPFPFATDDHQVVNARALVDSGAAEMIFEKDLTGKILAERIVFYSENHEVKGRMESKIRKFGHPDAAQRIVDDIYRMIHNNTPETACAA
ncbi:MAG: undecaprenyldiphospho-muramoylpentapeptide beta-N-acetylglucosaminyltransferase [Desulfobacteraceae bacterium]|nr:undecaprenyldiphospho-muramoylpentapeptide beta-N-acetylglucosaminyltransferase [Desulfobacteraceae bacterium]MBC2756035.1 undecaprenyldiphospho-muramoylpentapeptide beta-N-acetylglucosaminyltransferase [Desulfobacteraceae bacterium]